MTARYYVVLIILRECNTDKSNVVVGDVKCFHLLVPSQILTTMLHIDGIGDEVDLRRVQVRMKYTKLMNTADPPPSRFRLFAEDLL